MREDQMSDDRQNSFCVPFALGFIAGLTPNETAAAIKAYLVTAARNNAKRYTREARQHSEAGNEYWAETYKKYAQNAAQQAAKNARTPIKGVQTGIYTRPEFLASIGLRIKAHVERPGMTLKSWCAVREKWGDKGTWLVANSGHALVYCDGRIYDNRNKAGVPYVDYEFATTRLAHAELLERVDGTRFVS